MGKRKDILAAAEKLLAQRGFYGLSMKVLAQKAGMATGTIYRYFENKEMLMIELHHHISSEASQTIFSGYSDEQTPEQQYILLWTNVFNAVLENPMRSMVMEMLYCTPNINQQEANNFEDIAFEPLLNFYQTGIDEQRFHDWPIAALISLSFYSAINLAKKILRERLEIDEKTLKQVRYASWKIIQLTKD